MRSGVVPLGCVLAVVCTGACMPEETAHTVASLPPAYRDLPVPPGGAIEPGSRVTLDARQQEAVVTGVAKWMKEPRTAQFGAMDAARNSHGLVTVCGQVNGLGDKGAYLGMTRYLGVLMGQRASQTFVVVAIAGSRRERAEIAGLCRESGIALPE
ncbi:MAG: hypothetical protein FJX11_12090 [Alphaproteobacteria bacterium]|nr:hypothetical protein [Alphaproteobacteria bacterium]